MTYRLLLPPPFFFTDLRDKFKTLHPPFLRFSHEPKKKKKKSSTRATMWKPRCYQGVWRGRGFRDLPAAIWSPHTHSALALLQFPSPRSTCPCFTRSASNCFFPEQRKRNKAQQKRDSVPMKCNSVCVYNKQNQGGNTSRDSFGRKRKKKGHLSRHGTI